MDRVSQSPFSTTFYTHYEGATGQQSIWAMERRTEAKSVDATQVAYGMVLVYGIIYSA